MKTYIVEHTNGTQVRVKVPDNTTVTFGGLIPGAKVDGGANRTALRFYRGKNQIAVLTGVESFRLLEDVEILKKEISVASKDVAFNEDGITKVKSVQVRTEEWRNLDLAPNDNNANTLLKQLQIETN